MEVEANMEDRYRVFISFKNTDLNGKPTEDSKIAEELYDKLIEEGINTFFSNQELNKKGDLNWDGAIDKALKQADILLLVTTSVEHLNSPQVRREWYEGFLSEIRSVNKPDSELLTVVKGLAISELPYHLNSRWPVYDYDVYPIETIVNHIKAALGLNRIEKGSTNYEENIINPYDKIERSKRLKYTSDFTSLRGRDSEIQFLKEFCMGDSNPVRWTYISGEGGSGKSKLAYEFCQIMVDEGWHVYRPCHAETFKDKILEDISQKGKNLLICFDYVKFELLSIRDLIRKFIDNPGRFSHKIRIILVERNKEDIIDSSIFNEEIRRRYYGSGIDLQPLSVESLSDLISDYVRNLSNKMIDEKSCKEIMNTLRVVDSQLTRPIML